MAHLEFLNAQKNKIIRQNIVHRYSMVDIQKYLYVACEGNYLNDESKFTLSLDNSEIIYGTKTFLDGKNIGHKLFLNDIIMPLKSSKFQADLASVKSVIYRGTFNRLTSMISIQSVHVVVKEHEILVLKGENDFIIKPMDNNVNRLVFLCDSLESNKKFYEETYKAQSTK